MLFSWEHTFEYQNSQLFRYSLYSTFNHFESHPCCTFSAECVFCILIAVGASASVHRVSATTCLIFSVMMVYSINKISQKVPHSLQHKPTSFLGPMGLTIGSILTLKRSLTTEIKHVQIFDNFHIKVGKQEIIIAGNGSERSRIVIEFIVINAVF